ncbi:hypothetical protein [Streptomyces sp. NPDC059009]|uniref:hypothetical protein n=1 Tax=Streptomyces sp. NPDC059009 TaxID=3346694 RepID=UPI0036BAECA5
MAEEGLPQGQCTDTRRGDHGFRLDDDLNRIYKQASLRDQRRIYVREEVTRLRAGGSPPERPLSAAPPDFRCSGGPRRARPPVPRWTVESLFWMAGIVVTGLVWEHRGVVASLVGPLTAVAFAVRHRFLEYGSMPVRGKRVERRRRQERLANR